MISIALALAQLAGHLAPTVAGWLGGPKAEDTANKVVSIAQTITGQPTGDAALAAIQADPNLAMQFQKALMDNQVQLAQIAAQQEQAELTADTANTAAVNQTMQVEAKADHWPTYSWRPACGFAFALLAVMAGLTVMGAYVGVMFFRVEPSVLGYIPGMLGAEAAVMGTMAPVLGIASYFRGKMQANPNLPTDNRG